MAFSIQIVGLRELQAEFSNKAKSLESRGNAIIKRAAQTYVRNAKRDAPKDMGKLAQGISTYQEKPLHHVVVSASNYSKYIEFGTKTKFQPIPGVNPNDYPSPKTGDYFDFLNSILDWVKRKGIGSTYTTGIVKTKGGGYAYDMNRLTPRRRGPKKAELLRIAEAIAWSIMKKGIKPQPFFFKQSGVVRQQLEQEFKQLVETLA